MKALPSSTGMMTRLAEAARYLISGAAPSAWYGPLQPEKPMAPDEVAGRRFDYPVGYNLGITARASEPVTFDDLRALADNCDILRSVIETRKDQMEALEWSVRVMPSRRERGGHEGQVEAATAFLNCPDGEHSFSQWLRQVLEDVFVIDAVALYKRRTRTGGLAALEVVDGATIRPLLDASGRTPPSPQPAYQQILKGVPAVDYTREELIYFRHNPRSHKVYGYSHVEQVLVTVNILIRRALHQLEYYREGSQPDALIGVPRDWTQEQIAVFQKSFDSMLAGNSAQRRHVRFLPGEFKYQETKAPPLKDAYDEYLARIICFVFSVSPEPFVGQVNRATAQSAQERARAEGLAPLQKTVRELMNRILQREMGFADLEFLWQEGREQDPKDAAQIDVAYVGAGILTVDEVRQRMGLKPLAAASAHPPAYKFNPNHDERGRFTTGDGNVTGTEELPPGITTSSGIMPASSLPPDGVQVAENTKDIIYSEGRLIGEKGSGLEVQMLEGGYKGEKGVKGAEKLFHELTDGKNGVDITPDGYKGKMIRLPGGDVIGIRYESKSGHTTVDVNMGEYWKFKFP